MPLRLGLVTGEFPPMEGGVGAFTQELAQALSQAGHEIHIVTDRRARPPVEKRRWRDLSEPIDVGYGRLSPIIRSWGWASLGKVADIAIRNDLDLVNVQYQAAAYNMRNAAVNLLPWRLKGITKCVVTFHDLRVPFLFPKAGRLRKALVTVMARQAHGVIVTNAADRQELATRLGDVERLAQIPIGSNIRAADVRDSAVIEARERMNVAPTDCLLGYFGFFNESKGGDVLLEALVQLEESFKLVFIGGQTGSSDSESNRAFHARLSTFIADRNLRDRIHQTSFVAGTDVSTYMRAVDIMVMPYRDGASLRRGTLMATLAHGRALITTRPLVPVSELVHCDNVYFVPPGDAGALAEAIRTLASNEQMRRRIEQGAAQVAQLFTWDKIATRTAAFYSRIVTESGPEERR